MDSDKFVKDVIRRALSLIEELNVDPNLKPIAFQEVIRYLLQAEGMDFEKKEAEGASIMKPSPSKIPFLDEMTYEEYTGKLRKKIKTNPEKLLVIVYWLATVEKRECVTQEDIKAKLQEDPVWGVPGNLPRDLKAARTKGYLTFRKEGNQKCWAPTDTGKRKILEWLDLKE